MDHVLDIQCTLEECNKEQRSICNEVLESLIAINQKTLLSFLPSDGSCRTGNVGQLLFEDIFELSRHFQSGMEEHVKSYQKKSRENKCRPVIQFTNKSVRVTAKLKGC